jgi:hypothetical protein
LLLPWDNATFLLAIVTLSPRSPYAWRPIAHKPPMFLYGRPLPSHACRSGRSRR